MSLRIVLTDDHPVVRAGLRMLLESQPGWEVVAESADAETAARQVRGHKPDVLVLDLTMPGRPTLDVVTQVRRDRNVLVPEDTRYFMVNTLPGASSYGHWVYPSE